MAKIITRLLAPGFQLFHFQQRSKSKQDSPLLELLAINLAAIVFW